MELTVAIHLAPAGADAPAALRGAWQGQLTACDGTPLAVEGLAFDALSFSPAMFSAFDIDCPDSVARSVPKRQAEFFFGRLAARRALVRADRALAQAQIPIGEARAPGWPRGMIGSISHTQGLAAAVATAAGPWRGIGIDLERVVDEKAAAALQAMAVDAAELAQLRALAGSQPVNALLTTVFSAKESLFKGAYAAVGRYFDFSAARVVTLDPARGRLQLRLTETLCPQFVQGQECEVGFDQVDAGTVITHFVW